MIKSIIHCFDYKNKVVDTFCSTDKYSFVDIVKNIGFLAIFSQIMMLND